MDPRTNCMVCRQCRPERSFGKRRFSEQMSQEPAQASFGERVPEAGPCSRIGERTLGAFVSPPDGFPVLSQVGPALVRRLPSRSDLAISCWKAHGWLVWAGHENDGPCVTRCVHMWCSQRWETTRLLPGLQGHSLRQPTINPASSLFPPSVQVLPVVAAPASARLVLSQHDSERMTDRLLPFPARANTARGRGKERSRWRWEPGACVSSLAARTSSRLCRSRTCPVTLLAVHTASAHEAGYNGSFQERHQTLLPRYGAVPFAPPHAAPPSAALKREDRMPGSLALAAAA